MSNVLNVSEAASLALHAAALLACNPEGPVTTREIAERLGASEAHLSKVLQRLVKEGLLRSMRGQKGGFVLARQASRISLLDLYKSIEGPLLLSKCLFGRRICSGEGCILGGFLETVSRDLREYMAGTKL
ncbi:MAG: RrF2 family transcriptional regulator, partial [bacterium]